MISLIRGLAADKAPAKAAAYKAGGCEKARRARRAGHGASCAALGKAHLAALPCPARRTRRDSHGGIWADACDFLKHEVGSWEFADAEWEFRRAYENGGCGSRRARRAAHCMSVGHCKGLTCVTLGKAYVAELKCEGFASADAWVVEACTKVTGEVAAFEAAVAAAATTTDGEAGTVREAPE